MVPETIGQPITGAADRMRGSGEVRGGHGKQEWEPGRGDEMQKHPQQNQDHNMEKNLN